MINVLDLEELFKKRPFIYYIDGEYYAFGMGVCAKCNKKVNYVTLPTRYENYVLVKAKDISQRDAWNIYRKLVSVADNVKDGEKHTNLQQKFEEMGFTNEERDEIEKQLSDLVEFFVKYRLVDYYR